MRVQDAAPPPTSLPSLSPGQSAAIGQGVTQAAVENAPGASIAAALRNSQRIGMGIAPALRAGDYAGAGAAFVQSTAAALGAIPGVHLLPGFAGIIQAYHGSPHIFDEFKSSAIGTGEGAQAYGHGLYFAENPGVAESYSKIPNMQRVNDLNARMGQLSREMDKYAVPGQYRKFRDPRGEEAAAEYDRLMDERAKPTGALYSVKLDVNHDDLLDWDKPLSEQPAGVKALAAQHFEGVQPLPSGVRVPHKLPSDTTGADLYDMLSRRLGSPEAAASALREAGVPGTKYLDAGSRRAGDGTRNVVLFDASLARIEAVNGQPVPSPAEKAADGLSLLAHPEAWGAKP